MRVRQDVGGEGVADSRRRRVALALIIGIFMAGCSDADGDEPFPTMTAAESRPVSTATAEPPTTPAPGPAPWPEPTRPAAMERDDIEGAKAAAEYFLDLYPYVYVTGDLEAWGRMSHPECMFCAGVVENVEELHSGGGYADGPTLDIITVEAAPPGDGYDFYSVWIEANERASARYDRSGRMVDALEGSLLKIDMALTRSDGQWLIRGAVGSGAEEGSFSDSH